MSIKMINKDDCNTCIHKKVCQYQLEKEEAINQISTRVVNVSTGSINFTITFNCEHYYKEETKRTSLNRCSGDDSTSTINPNPYW